MKMRMQIFRVLVFAALATTIAFGSAIAQLSAEQIKEIRTRAEQGDTEAQFNLGSAHFFGHGVAKDMREALRWFRKVAEQGMAEAQFFLGYAYSSGEGIVKDQREAVRWYRKAAEQGLAGAQYSLAQAYGHGEGVAKDRREAARWYRKAAERGLAVAQFNLALAYWSGKGIARDQHEAIRWYKKAAEQGFVKAQHNLGVIYSNGEGVAKDQRKAMQWWRQAAEQGLTEAQFNLALTYWNGDGVAKNQREAIRWFRKAAEQGDAEAQYNLALAYWNGAGVITDKHEAYIWFSISKANGYNTAAGNLHNVDWRNYFSQEAIRSAQKEAARRLEAIEKRRENSVETPAVGANIAIAAAPKGTNIAAKVFDNTWRSVVVVINGDNQGSGVIIHSNIVATNCHVVSESGNIAVYKSDDRRVDADNPLPATIRHADDDYDFCLLDVDGLWGVPATVRRYDTLKVGEDVYGLGAPKGLDLSLSDGLVSQLREVRSYRVIQTNVAISPGSSGGGLFDSEGNLVGIMTEKIADEETEGIGFAIPADLVLEH